MNWEQQRNAMVEEQLVARGIRDKRVLDAMRQVPRHLFVPESERKWSHEDRPLAIGYGQTISQPFMVATMLQALHLKGEENVLEIGTGSGYEAALLGCLAQRVETVEIVPELASQARDRMAALSLTHVRVHPADGSCGLPDHAPFDAILVAAAAPDVPSPLLEQLKPKGKLLIPIGDRIQQVLMLIQKTEAQTTQEALCGCAFVPLTGQHGWEDP